MASLRESLKRNGTDPSLREATRVRDPVLTSRGESISQAQTGQFERGFDQSLNQQKRGLYDTIRAVGAETGIDTLEQFGAEGADRAGRVASALPRLAQPSITEVENVGDVLDWAMGGLGQLAGSALPTVAAGAAGAAAAPFTGGGSLLPAAGAFLTSAVPEVGHAYRDIEETTGEGELLQSIAIGGSIGAIDTLAAGRLVRAGLPRQLADKVLGRRSLTEAEEAAVRQAAANASSAGRAARNIGGAAASEGATEGVQEFIGRGGRFLATDDAGFDPLSEEALNDYINAVAVGALGGGTVGTAGSVAKAAAESQPVQAAREQVNQRLNPPAPETDEPTIRELPPALQQLSDTVQKYLPQQGPGAESRGVMGLTDAAESGALLEAYQRSGLSQEDALDLQDMTMEAMELAATYLQNPDTPVPERDLATIQQILEHPVNRQIFETSEAIDQREADAGLDEAVATADDQGRIDQQMQETIDQGALSLYGDTLEGDGISLDGIGVLPDEEVQLADLNLNLENTDASYKLFNPTEADKEGRPLVSAEGSSRAQEAIGSDKRFTRGALERAIDRFNLRNEDRKAEAVPYTEIVEQQARKEAQEMELDPSLVGEFIEARKLEEARRLWRENLGKGAVANLYKGPQSVDSFLSAFGGMKVSTNTRPARGVSDAGTLTSEDLEIGKTGPEAEKVGQRILFEMARGRQEAAPTQGRFTVDVEGRADPIQADAPRLTQLFLSPERSPQRAEARDMTELERIADAFYRGVSQLASAERGVGFGPDTFKDSLVVFRREGGDTVTFGEIKNLRSPSMQARSLGEFTNQLRRDFARTRDRAREAQARAESLPEGPEREQALARAEELRQQASNIQRTGSRAAQREEAASRAPRPEREADINREALRRQEAQQLAQQERQEVEGVEAEMFGDPAPVPRAPVRRGGASRRQERLGGNQIGDFNHDIQDVGSELNMSPGDPNYMAGLTAEVLTRYLDNGALAPRAVIEHAQSLLPPGSPGRYTTSMPQLRAELQRIAKMTDVDQELLANITETEQQLLSRLGISPTTGKQRESTGQRAARSRAKANEGVREQLEQMRKWSDDLHKRYADEKAKTDNAQRTFAGGLAQFADTDSEIRRVHDLLQEDFTAWTEELGLQGKARLVTPSEALQRYDGDPSADMANIMYRFGQGQLFGTAIQSADGTFDILINPLLDPISAREQMAHEIGHVFKVESANRLTNLQAQNIIREFERWLGSISKDTSVYRLLGDRKSARSQLAAMMGHTSQLRMRDLQPEEQNYLTSFDEWFADRVGQVLLAKRDENTTSIGRALDRLIKVQAEGFERLFGDKYKNSTTAFFKDGELQSIMQGPPREDDVWAAVQGSMPDTSKMKFSQGVEHDPNGDGEAEGQPRQTPLELLDERVRERLGIGIEELAQGQRTMTQAEFRQRIIAAAMSGRPSDTAVAQNQLNRVMMNWVFDNVLNTAETNVLGRLVQDPQIRAQLLRGLQHDADAIAEINNPLTGNRAAVGYLYMLHMARPDVYKITPRSRGIFDKVRKLMLDIVGIVSTTDQADQIVRALEGGNLVRGNRTFTLQTAIRDNIYRVLVQDGAELWQNFSKKFNPLTGANQVLLNSEVPALMQLAGLFDRNYSAAGEGKTFTEERTEQVNKYINRVNRIFKDASREQVEATKEVLFDYVNKAPLADAEVKRMADDVLLMLHDLFLYFQDSGVAGTGQRDMRGNFTGMGKRGEEVTVTRPGGGQVKVRAYFPWVVDIDKFAMGGTERFARMLHRPEYDQKLAEMLEEVNQSRITRGAPPMTKDQLIDQLVVHISNDGGTVETELNPDAIGHIPKMTAYNPRSWAWLTEGHGDVPVSQESINDWYSLQHDSMYGILHSYIEQGVKRSIYTKRFGRNGAKLKAIMNQARNEGADDQDIRNAQKYIDAMLGTHGHQTYTKLVKGLNWARNIIGKEPLPLPERGRPINNKLQKATQWLMVYQNFRLLDFAVLTSLMDPVGILARTGDMKMAWGGLKAGFKDSYDRNIKGDETMANSIAELLGIVENNVISEALQWNYSGNFMSGKARAANDWFFRWNGLQGWTRMTRIMATSAGMQFLKHHSQVAAVGRTRALQEQSTRYLNELGLQKHDLEGRFDEDGNLKLMPEDQYDRLLEQAQEDSDAGRTAKQRIAEEDRVRTALIRFTNEAILRPNAAQRPIWASDPHFAVFFHLKQFIWSFHTRILGRMVHEAQFGNYHPLMAVPVFMGVMAGADQMREYLKYGSEGNPHRQSWGFTDHLWHAFQRAGLTGTYQSIVDAEEDTTYGGFGFESFAGPTVNQGLQWLKAPFRDDDYFWKQMDRALPFNNTRDMTEIANWQ